MGKEENIVPMANMLTALLNLDESVLDTDQVENLIKICPTQEEIDSLKVGEVEQLDNSEQFFIEMMRIPRIETKLRVFLFKLHFTTQVAELWTKLILVQDASKEVRGSKRFRRIMQNAIRFVNTSSVEIILNDPGVGLKLESLLRLAENSPLSNTQTKPMEIFHKLVVEKDADLLEFHKDLDHLEGASKISLKQLTEDMQVIISGLQEVEQELAASQKDGPISEGFRTVLKSFLKSAQIDQRSLAKFFLEVVRDADLLVQFFDRDSSRCPVEQVTTILFKFVNTFRQAGDNKKSCKETLDTEGVQAPENSSRNLCIETC